MRMKRTANRMYRFFNFLYRASENPYMKYLLDTFYMEYVEEIVRNNRKLQIDRSPQVAECATMLPDQYQARKVARTSRQRESLFAVSYYSSRNVDLRKF